MNYNQSSSSCNLVKPGSRHHLHPLDVISIKGIGPVRHKLVCIDPARLIFVHNSNQYGEVVIEQLAPFTIEDDMRIEMQVKPGHEQVLAQRIRSMIGQRYDLIGFNCEHFVTCVCDGRPSSSQLQEWSLLALVIALGLLVIFSPDKPKRLIPS